MAYFNSYHKIQDLRFLNGTIHHVIVDGTVWSDALIFLTHYLSGITHLKAMFHVQRNQVIDLHKQKLKTVPEWGSK